MSDAEDGALPPKDPTPLMTVSVAVDIGGTFTDVVAFVGNDTVATKVSSTPNDLTVGVMDGLRSVLGHSGVRAANISVVIHASTVASNALLERTGANTALVVTDGFGDILEIGRQRRADPYDLRRSKVTPIVPRHQVFELKQRQNHLGHHLVEIDERQVSEIGSQLRQLGVEAVAVSFLHSYANGEDELRVVDLLRPILGERVVFVASHQVLSEAREYERTSTAVIAAYLIPRVSTYLAKLDGLLGSLGCPSDLWMMKSNGGLTNVTHAVLHPEQLVESGPAAGVIGAARMARELNLDSIISFDMGGTTAKASVILDAEPTLNHHYEVGGAANAGAFLKRGTGFPLRAPVVDLAEVGTGGGSIAWVDEGGALRVGPRSAGSVPGPACYGLGGQWPTITDADVVLGYLRPAARSHLSKFLDQALATAAIDVHIARPLGLSPVEAAQGILDLAHAQMAHAVRLVTVSKGLDPRDFTLIPFGGAGPVHAWAVAQELGVRRLLVPPLPGVFSAAGLLVADFRVDVGRGGRWSLLDETVATELWSAWSELSGQATQQLMSQGHAPDSIRIQLAADMRYVGQSYEVTVSLPSAPTASHVPGDLSRLFHAAHEISYGYSSPTEAVEVVVLRVAATVPTPSHFAQVAPVEDHDKAESREIWFGNNSVQCRVIDRSAIGQVPHKGPMAITQPDTTVLVPPDAEVVGIDGGFLRINLPTAAKA